MIVYTVEGSHNGLIHATTNRKSAIQLALEYVAAPPEPKHIRELEEHFAEKMKQYYRYGIYLGEKDGKTGVTITAWDSPTPVKAQHIPSGVKPGDFVDFREGTEVIYQQRVTEVTNSYKVVVEGREEPIGPERIVKVYHKVY